MPRRKPTDFEYISYYVFLIRFEQFKTTSLPIGHVRDFYAHKLKFAVQGQIDEILRPLAASVRYPDALRSLPK